MKMFALPQVKIKVLQWLQNYQMYEFKIAMHLS